MESPQENKKSSFWKLNQEQLTKQLENYNTLSLWRSYRKLSAFLMWVNGLILLFAIVLLKPGAKLGGVVFDTGTALLIFILFVLLGIFMYRGYKWAILTTIVVWTLDRGIAAVSQFLAPGGAVGVAIVLWWALFVNIFWKAFQVERARGKNLDHKGSEMDVGEKKSNKILLTAKIIIAISLAFGVISSFYFSPLSNFFDRVVGTLGNIAALLIFAFIPSGISYFFLKKKYKNSFLIIFSIFLLLATAFSTIGRLYDTRRIPSLSALLKSDVPLEIQEKCREAGEKLYKEDAKGIYAPAYMETPRYGYNKKLNVCLYRGGYYGNNTPSLEWSKWIKNSFTNETIIEISPLSIVLDFNMQKHLPGDDLLDENKFRSKVIGEFEQKERELFGD